MCAAVLCCVVLFVREVGCLVHFLRATLVCSKCGVSSIYCHAGASVMCGCQVGGVYMCMCLCWWAVAAAVVVVVREVSEVLVVRGVEFSIVFLPVCTLRLAALPSAAGCCAVCGVGESQQKAVRLPAVSVFGSLHQFSTSFFNLLVGYQMRLSCLMSSRSTLTLVVHLEIDCTAKPQPVLA